MPAFYGMRWFIALLTRDRLLTPCLLIPFLKSHYSVILPSTPRSSKWSLSLQVSSPNPCMHLSVSHMCRLPCPSHAWYDHLNNIWWGVHIISFLLCSSTPCYLVPLRSKYRSQHPIVKQWRTQEFFSGGGSTNSVEDRGQRGRGSGGGSPLVRCSGGSCNLVQEISFHIVKLS